MTFTTRFVLALAGLLAFLAAPPVVPTATAGCGCDHPPPAWGLVMPSFAAAGKTIRIHSDGFDFQAEAQYLVEFGSGGGDQASVTTIAENSGYLDVMFPAGVRSGPTEIRVTGHNVNHTYSSHFFTTLSPFLVVPPVVEGTFVARHVEAAVTWDGTLLLPVNVRHVLEPTQFAFQLIDLPYAFTAEDVVIYNAADVALTLFTLAVDGQTDIQWGSYYGWEVEDDMGISGIVYDTKVQRSSAPGKTSDVLTYWRHEFHTYTQAHQPGGSHELKDGFHPKGKPTYSSLHINHGHLVLAISGLKRSANDPDDPSSASALSPGRVWVNVAVQAVQSANPVEPGAMAGLLEGATVVAPFDPAEPHFDEFAPSEGDDNDDQGGEGGKGKK